MSVSNNMSSAPCSTASTATPAAASAACLSEPRVGEAWPVQLSGPEFLLQRIRELSIASKPSPWLFGLGRLLGSASVPSFATILQGVQMHLRDTPIDVSRIHRESWMSRCRYEFSANSPAVVKLMRDMPPDALFMAYGDSVGYGSGKVEGEERKDNLDSYFKNSYENGLFSVEKYKNAIGAQEFVFSDDTVEALYTELAIDFVASKKGNMYAEDFISAVERELMLLLVRIDKAGDPVQRSNGSSRKAFAGSIMQKICTRLNDSQNLACNEIQELCSKSGVAFRPEQPGDSYAQAYQIASGIEASHLINSINRQVLSTIAISEGLYNQLTRENANARPGCGSAMRSGCIGRIIARSLGDPTKVSEAEFKRGVSLTVSLALSLSRITHPQAGASLSAAVHALTIYLIAFDVPLHLAQEIALEHVHGKECYNYVMWKTVPVGQELEGPFQANWEEAYKIMRCGVDMRRFKIYNSSEDLQKFKLQLLASTSQLREFSQQKNRPYVKDGSLCNPRINYNPETAPGSDCWSGCSVDMPILATQCVYLALNENEPFMQELARELNQHDPNPGMVFPHILRIVWQKISPDERLRIDTRITELACFTPGDKDSIGAQSKLLQALFFGIDEHSLQVALMPR